MIERAEPQTIKSLSIVCREESDFSVIAKKYNVYF